MKPRRRKSRTCSASRHALAQRTGGTYYGPGTPYQYYQDQFSSLYAWQTRSNSNYNALQVTLRHAMSAGLQFDLNYVYSKSIDASSNAERVNGFEAAGGVAYNNQAINAWSPDLWRAPSDFDTTHQINFNVIWDLPFGKGRRSSIVKSLHEFRIRRLGIERPGPLDQRLPVQRLRRCRLGHQF